MLLAVRREVGAAQPRQGTVGRAARGIFRIVARQHACSKEKGNRNHDEATLGGLAQARAEVPSPSFLFKGSCGIVLEGQADFGLHLAPLRRGAMDELSDPLSLMLSRFVWALGGCGLETPSALTAQGRMELDRRLTDATAETLWADLHYAKSTPIRLLHLLFESSHWSFDCQAGLHLLRGMLDTCPDNKIVEECGDLPE